jgi:hypothetical protein
MTEEEKSLLVWKYHIGLHLEFNMWRGRIFYGNLWEVSFLWSLLLRTHKFWPCAGLNFFYNRSNCKGCTIFFLIQNNIFVGVFFLISSSNRNSCTDCCTISFLLKIIFLLFFFS